MSKKKPIAAFEEYLDKKAVTTVEEDVDREVLEIVNLLEQNKSMADMIFFKVLVSKGLVSIKDFKRALED